MLAQLRAVLAKRQLIRGVHSVFGRVIDALAAFFAYETNNLAFVAFFSHIRSSLTEIRQFVNGLRLRARPKILVLQEIDQI